MNERFNELKKIIVTDKFEETTDFYKGFACCEYTNGEINVKEFEELLIIILNM